MFDHYLTYRSLTRAQSAQRALRAVGVPSKLGRAPETASAHGCGYALQIREQDLTRAAETLQRQGLQFVRLFRRQNGCLEEIAP